MTPDNVIELERRRQEHREAEASRTAMRERIVELEAEVADLRRQLAARPAPGPPLEFCRSFPHGP